MEKSNGSLIVKTSAALEAIPIEDAEITVRGSDNFNKDVIYFVTTDIDGLSPVIMLPTPGVEYSLSPGSNILPYSRYNVEIKKEGYYTKVVNDVAIFAGTEAILPVNMIPITPGENSPSDSNNSTVTENDKL